MREQIKSERHHRGDGASFYEGTYEGSQVQKNEAYYTWQELKCLHSALLKHKGGVHDQTVLAVGRKVVTSKRNSVNTNREALEVEKRYTQKMNIDWLVSVFADRIGDAFYDDDHNLLPDDDIVDAIYHYCNRWIEEVSKTYPPSDDLVSYIESSLCYVVYVHLRGLPKSTKIVGAKGYMTQSGILKVPSSCLLSDTVRSMTV